MIRSKVTTTGFDVEKITHHAMETVGERMSRNLSKMTCSVHGEHPTVKPRLTSRNEISLNITACCQEFADEVRAAGTKPGALGS